MTCYLNIDLGFPVGRFQFEIRLMLSHWELNLGNIHAGTVRHFSLGPLHASLTDREKLKKLFLDSE